MFLDKEDRPIFCYLPEYEKNIYEQLRDFLEECIEMISGNDKKKVRFYYEFHSFLVKEKPNMEQMKEYLEIVPETKKEKQKQVEAAFIEPEDPYEYPRQDQELTKEKDVKNIIKNIALGVLCILGLGGMIYFIFQIFEYGFYYLFLIGFLLSIAIIGLGVYGFYKLWRKSKNKNKNVDFYEEKENLTVLLEDKTTLLEEEDDRTVLLMEEPIGKLIPYDREKEEIIINDNGFIIGSSMEGTDYQLEGTGISRRHIRFYQEAKKVYCEDLESTNGIKVNGRKIKSIALKDGDRIKIGLEEFVFHEV